MKTQNKTQTHFIPTSQLKLYNVANDQGEDLGQVQNFIVDMCSMRVAYVLVAFEGFLGLGDKWIPMPFEVLTWVPEKKRFMMGISRKTLEKAPTIAKSEWPDKFLDKLEVRDHASWLENVYGYYSLTPYWVEEICEPCATGAGQPVTVETTTTVIYAESGPTNNVVQSQSASAATAAAREALKAATRSEEASIEARAAKEALADACIAANKAEMIARANTEASARATQDARSAEELARKAQEAAHAAKNATDEAYAAILRAEELVKADIKASEKATQDAGNAEEVARRAVEAAHTATKATDEATANAGEAARRVDAATRKAEDTARAAEVAAGEDSIKAQEAAQVARGAVLTATRAFVQSGTCE